MLELTSVSVIPTDTDDPQRYWKAKLEEDFQQYMQDWKLSSLTRKRKCSLPLMPDSPGQNFVGLLVILAFMYNVTYLPYQIAFLKNDNASTLHPVDAVVDLVFFIQMILSFLTAFDIGDGTYETRFSKILVKYVRGWFLIDFVALAPYYMILQSPALYDNIGAIRFFRFLKVAQISRVVRSRKQNFVLASMGIRQVTSAVYQLILIWGVVFFFAHLAACSWFIIGSADPEHGWFSTMPEIIDASPWSQYIVCLYWSITTVTTVGYGDITAQTTGERIFSILAMLFGVLFSAWGIAAFTSFLHEYDERTARVTRKLHALGSFTKTRKISGKLSKVLKCIMRHSWIDEEQSRANYAEDWVVGEFPSFMKKVVALQLNQSFISDSESLRELYSIDQEFVLDLLGSASRISFYPGEFVVHKNDPVDHVFIVFSGEVELQACDLSIETCARGEWVGQIGCDPSVLTDWPCTVVARDTTSGRRRSVFQKAEPDDTVELLRIDTRKFRRSIIHAKYRELLEKTFQTQFEEKKAQIKARIPELLMSRRVEAGNFLRARTFAEFIDGEFAHLTNSATECEPGDHSDAGLSPLLDDDRP
eukprot:221484_1